MSNEDRKYRSTVGFTDLLFNLLVGFVFLFIIAFILINPPVKKSDAPKKAEYLVIVDWDPNMNDDVDTWIRDPNGITVSFTNKEGGLMNLEKDDLGNSNDTYKDPKTGKITYLPINREVVTFRGVVSGRYQIALHIYSRRYIVERDENGRNRTVSISTPGKARVTLIKLNPSYEEVYAKEVDYNRRGQQLTAFNFTLDADGNVISIDEQRNNIVLSGSGGGWLKRN